MEPTGTRSLEGKRALVTASSQGLGLAIATRLAEEGCRVAINARGATLADAADAILARTGRRPVTLAADLARPADAQALVGAAVSALGGLDILVVNSGHIPYGTLETLSDDDWYGAFELLLMSAVRLTRNALPALRAAGGGNIVFVGSASVRQPPPHLLLSSVMRLGVAGLAKTLTRSLAGEGIRVNVVAPGYFMTGRVQARIAAAVAAGGTPAAAAQAVAEDIPMGRLGQPEELAALVAYLVGPGAGFLTGAHLAMDGGADTFPI